MIVPSMTAEEIHKEIMRDYPAVANKAHAMGLLYQTEMKRKGLQTETRSFIHKTPHRNEWTVLIKMTRNWIKRSFHLKTYDKKGMVAYMIQFIGHGTEIEDFYIIKYNTHFFKRYNERTCFNVKEPQKVVKQFFRNNFEQDPGRSEELEDGTRYIYMFFEEGMGIGWQDDAKKTLHMKTFIDNATMSAKKRTIAEHVRAGDDDFEFKMTLRPENAVNKF